MDTAHFGQNRKCGGTCKTSHLLAISAAEQEGTQGSENTALGTERDAEQTNKWNRVPGICFWLFSLKYLAY